MTGNSSNAATDSEVTDERASGMEVAVVSGLSGAGRSTAAKCLEDLGWFVVDNLPPALIPTMDDLGADTRTAPGTPRGAARRTDRFRME